MGPSGCGKSTIISLIQRFYRPDTGSISLGGDLIESLNLDWYRGLLGAVNQDTDVRWNHSFQSPAGCGENASRCRVGGGVVFGLINEMPDRLDTDLGAVGTAVLGGQKQRLAFM